VSSLRASGQDAAITLYPGAHHAFDNITLGYIYLPNADNGAGCTLRIASILGPLPSASDVAACLRKGATIAGNAEAAASARRNVRNQLGDLLK